MTEMLNMNALFDAAKAAWLEANAQRQERGFIAGVKRSEPYWLVIIGVVMFLLSAAHTIDTFSRMITSWTILGVSINPAVLAPFGVEFAILYCAFRLKRAGTGDPEHRTIANFERLMFATSVLVNGAGAIFAVISYNKIRDLSFGSIYDGFGKLPAELQVALVVAFSFSLIIPFSTHICGQGFATLVLERSAGDAELIACWNVVAPDELYKAVYQWHLNNGFKPGRASKLSRSLVSKYLQRPDTTSATSSNQSQPTATSATTKLVSYVDAETAWARFLSKDWSGYSERDAASEIGCSRDRFRKMQAQANPRPNLTIVKNESENKFRND